MFLKPNRKQGKKRDRDSGSVVMITKMVNDSGNRKFDHVFVWQGAVRKGAFVSLI